jgi:YD repeat-containing protein
MRILEMVEEIEEQAEAAGGYELVAPPGWSAATTPDADLHWRAAPNPISGGLFQDPDFTYPTTAGPLAFRLFYYSGNAAVASEYGSGRRASWPLRLTSDGTTVTVMHDDGVDRQYRNDGTNHFAVIGPPSGDTLTYDAVNGWDETRGDTGYKFHFPVGNYVSLAYRQTPQGLFVTCSYDTNQRLQSLVEPAGRRLTFSYNSDGRVQLVQDWGYRQDTIFTYVGSDMTEVWEPNGAVTQYRYDASHRMTAVYDPAGYGTTYTYDYASRVLSRSVAGNLGLYTYVTAGPTLQTGYTDPLGNTWTHLSSGGIPTGQIDPLGNTQTYVYQSCRPVAITNALGYTTTYSYDTYGFQTGRQDALGNRWTYTRDAGAHVILTAQDPLGYVTTYAWGASPALRQLQGITDPLGNTTTIGYLSNGLPQYRQDPLGNIRTYTWSGQALLSAETNPLGYITTYQYDVGTNRVGMADALGNQWTTGSTRCGGRSALKTR